MTLLTDTAALTISAVLGVVEGLGAFLVGYWLGRRTGEKRVSGRPGAPPIDGGKHRA